CTGAAVLLLAVPSAASRSDADGLGTQPVRFTWSTSKMATIGGHEPSGKVGGGAVGAAPGPAGVAALITAAVGDGGAVGPCGSGGSWSHFRGRRANTTRSRGRGYLRRAHHAVRLDAATDRLSPARHMATRHFPPCGHGGHRSAVSSSAPLLVRSATHDVLVSRRPRHHATRRRHHEP